jgi:hypothetical protein
LFDSTYSLIYGASTPSRCRRQTHCALCRNEIDRTVSASDWARSPQTRNVEHRYLTKRPQLLHANTFHRHPATYSTVRRRHSALQQSGLTTSNHGSPSHDVNAHRVPYSDAFHATQRGFYHPLEHARLPSGRLPLRSVIASHSSLFVSRPPYYCCVYSGSLTPD